MTQIVSFLVLMLVWLLFTWSLDLQQVFVGAILAFIISFFLKRILREGTGKILNPLRWFWFIVYVFYFLYYCFRANLDVAFRVVHPDVPIRPGIVKVRTSLESDMARLFLANSITLTPGTLTVDIDGPDFYIHWINIDTDDAARRTAEITGRFEPLLRRIFE